MKQITNLKEAVAFLECVDYSGLNAHGVEIKAVIGSAETNI